MRTMGFITFLLHFHLHLLNHMSTSATPRQCFNDCSNQGISLSSLYSTSKPNLIHRNWIVMHHITCHQDFKKTCDSRSNSFHSQHHGSSQLSTDSLDKATTQFFYHTRFIVLDRRFLPPVQNSKSFSLKRQISTNLLHHPIRWT